MTVRYWCILPAAGKGTRMGVDRPKQYLSLLNKTVIEHTLERLLSVSQIEKIVVALSPEDQAFETLAIATHPRILLTTGGKERCHSVLNGLTALTSQAQANDWVLVHDAARPCVRKSDIEKLMQQLQTHAVGGILGYPVRDTMKRTGKDNAIIDTVDRDGLWHALTPQMFRYALLKEALDEAISGSKLVTDEASAIELSGAHPVMVEGAQDNIKITRPDDLRLAELFLTEQRNLGL
ncbi:MAG TPA: 2-C-methyl-D-erythritol 4-phosphate cytidylyltransferase [Pseudomonadales bacterium]|nr:2-C-methyl-D-erythritol 4-phosphate cytidylyltransferase [Pseudomonadales bacterium]